MLSGLRLYATLGVAGFLLAAFGGVYWKGRADCGARQDRLRDEAEDKWADRLAEVQSSLLVELLAVSKTEIEDRKALNDVIKSVPQTGVCVPADAVERLRELQND